LPGEQHPREDQELALVQLEEARLRQAREWAPDGPQVGRLGAAGRPGSRASSFAANPVA
jgi:hypothetical protein